MILSPPVWQWGGHYFWQPRLTEVPKWTLHPTKKITQNLRLSNVGVGTNGRLHLGGIEMQPRKATAGDVWWENHPNLRGSQLSPGGLTQSKWMIIATTVYISFLINCIVVLLLYAIEIRC